MATFRSFEDIEAWQTSRVLTREVYTLYTGRSVLPDFGLRDQIQRAAVSVMPNIAEGFERGSNRDFIRFLRIARGPVSEVRTQLFVDPDVGYVDQDTFGRLNGDAKRVAAMLNGLIRYLAKPA